MPEQAMSTENVSVDVSGRVMIIDGLPYASLVRDEGMPMRLTSALEASELTVDSVAPIVYRMSEGGGIKKAKKAIGKASCRRV